MDSSRPGAPAHPPPAAAALPAANTAPAGGGSRLARSAGLIGIATTASRVLGLVRDQVLAYFFGAGNEMDAFNVAFRIPNLLRDLFAEGAMTAAFVPTFTRYLRLHGREAAWRLGNLVINALAVVTVVLVLLGIVFAEPLVTLFARDTRRCRASSSWPISLARHDVPLPDARRGGGRLHGDAELAAPLLRPGALAGDVQRRHDRRRCWRWCRCSRAPACRRSTRWPSARSSAGSARS